MGRLRASYSSQRGNTSGQSSNALRVACDQVASDGVRSFVRGRPCRATDRREITLSPFVVEGLTLNIAVWRPRLQGFHLFGHLEHLGDAVPVAAGARNVQHL